MITYYIVVLLVGLGILTVPMSDGMWWLKFIFRLTGFFLTAVTVIILLKEFGVMDSIDVLIQPLIQLDGE